jgi:hypothetical protein
MKTAIKKWSPPVALLTAGLLAFNAIAIPANRPPANPGMIQFAWTPSASDTGANGFYTILSLPTNAPDLYNMAMVTNVPAGFTNVLVPASVLPGNPCFVFATFSSGGFTSHPTGPTYVDTNTVLAWLPLSATGVSASAK